MSATAAAAENPIQPWVKAIQEAETKFNDIAVPDGNIVRYQREATFAMQRIGADKLLQECTFESVRNALINVASVGLTLNPAMKFAYLVPRKENRTNTVQCCLDISYIGLVKVATDSGGVLAVSAALVRKNDHFIYNGAFAPPAHIFSPFATMQERGEIIGVYSTALLPNSIVQIDTLSMEEIAKIKKMSKAATGPWVDWEEEMIKKSVLKRASKLWPRTERLSKAEAVLNEHQGNEALIDGTTGELVAMPQSKSAPIAQATGREGGEKDAGSGSVADEKRPAAAGNTKPMSPSQGKLLAAKLRNAALSLVDLQVKFPGKCIDLEQAKEGETLFLMSEVNDVIEWIAANAKG